jgi:D-glycero-D-manno-heptose 1,7-bisphosphate phosphatase
MSEELAWPAAAFLDRDGTINVKAPEGDYVKSPAEVTMIAGAAEAVARLNAAGIPVFVVSNQRGIALGRMTEADVAAVNATIGDALAAAGARVDAWYHCPHDHDSCDCRKPRPGMLERAAAEHGIADLAQTVVVGDAESDAEAGRRVGAATLRIGHDVDDLAAAVDRIVSEARARTTR